MGGGGGLTAGCRQPLLSAQALRGSVRGHLRNSAAPGQACALQPGPLPASFPRRLRRLGRWPVRPGACAGPGGRGAGSRAEPLVPRTSVGASKPWRTPGPVGAALFPGAQQPGGSAGRGDPATCACPCGHAPHAHTCIHTHTHAPLNPMSGSSAFCHHSRVTVLEWVPSLGGVSPTLFGVRLACPPLRTAGWVTVLLLPAPAGPLTGGGTVTAAPGPQQLHPRGLLLLPRIRMGRGGG